MTDKQRNGSVDVFDLEIGSDRLVVISMPVSSPADLATLTAAERDVARHVLAGLSNAAIATRRGTSARTVANQLASIYRKLDVCSRAELAVVMLRSEEEQ